MTDPTEAEDDDMGVDAREPPVPKLMLLVVIRLLIVMAVVVVFALGLHSSGFASR